MNTFSFPCGLMLAILAWFPILLRTFTFTLTKFLKNMHYAILLHAQDVILSELW
jgi:hypothetical protein